jgi:serine/threonine protein phosphatase PrpC
MYDNVRRLGAPSTERFVSVTSSGVRDIRWIVTDSDEFVAVHAAGATDVGRVREHNEDAWLVGPPVFLVADGMGGHAFGDVASALAARAFEQLEGEAIVRDDIDRAFEQCFADVASLSAESGGAPGTTLVLAAWVVDHGGQWLVANIGDSRAYALIDGSLRRLTHDHSVVQELIDAGELDEDGARTHPDRHVITRSIGAMQSLPPDLTMPALPVGSRILLCSDGIYGEIDDLVIERVLTEAPSPSGAVELLIAAANAAGGHDNSTAVVFDLCASHPEGNEDTLGRPRSSVMEDTIPGSGLHA